MVDKTATMELLNAFTDDLTPEEEMLSGLQSLIAAEITLKRREHGMSQKTFAEEMGVTQALVSKWESGETNFTLKTLVQIASKLGIEMNIPFKMDPPITYSKVPDKIIDIFAHNPWKTCSPKNNNISYTTCSDELKEN